ncbi:MAG: peptide chain release factor N(5)-glutamine methyltransferase [Muribaculaceae bacterium]|nr:peptide chain release factor N(5)-glutamine methyltransferase [Muribaculaceae bacterium]
MENKDITIAQLGRCIESQLSPIYGIGEAKAMTRLIFHSLKGWGFTDLVIHSDNIATPYLIESVNKILDRLKNKEPLQYILGEAYFYGLNLKVSPETLIPRPETAELVDMIVKDFSHEKDLRVLDIGTGSGAIAIALSRNLPFAEVSAIDISSGAITIARENASALKARVSFDVSDIFDYHPDAGSFDIIVSNPPYIDESEKSDMDDNVLVYEPHTALFVPDDDPLKYYRTISLVAKSALSAEGALYFEINPRHAAELKELLVSEGFIDIELLKDISGKVRFISCRKG